MITSTDSRDCRNAFDGRDLIFVPHTRAWHSLKACIWAADRVSIAKKQSIATSYADLEEFFVTMLEVETPDKQMFVSTILDLEKNKPSEWLSHVKSTMAQISFLDPKADDLKELQEACIFPIRTPKGIVEVTKKSEGTEFVITDRPQYKELVSHIIHLDFSPEEVRDCSCFLDAMELGSKMVSKLIKESTQAEGGVRDDKLTKSIRSRKEALLRYLILRW